jgi:DNA-binding NarL/FixJ family response regulator
MEAMGGWFQLESAPGQGTSVTLGLPLEPIPSSRYDATASPHAAPQASSASMMPEVHRVLLADDHAVVRAGIRQFLEFAGGIQVIAEAGDGAAAARLVEEHQPDVAVLDIQMPGLSGIEVTQAIRAKGILCGILILTAYDDEPYVQAVLRAGANGYVLKTADPLEIAQAVRDVYAGKSVLDAALAMRLIRGEKQGSRSQNGAGSAQTDLVEQLTRREVEILGLAARGLTNKAIAVQLSISDRTVQNHLAHIFGKLNAASRTEAVMRAVSLGWIAYDVGTVPEE